MREWFWDEGLWECFRSRKAGTTRTVHSTTFVLDCDFVI